MIESLVCPTCGKYLNMNMSYDELNNIYLIKYECQDEICGYSRTDKIKSEELIHMLLQRLNYNKH